MNVTVGGIKGGAGMFTLATNLAIMLALKARDVLSVDADDQGTLADFAALREQHLEDGAGFACVEVAGESELRAFVLLNWIELRGPETEDAAAILGGGEHVTLLDCSLGNRKAVAHAAARAQSGAELRPRDPKACAELEGLFSFLNATPSRRIAHG